MQYLLLIYADEKATPAQSPASLQRWLEVTNEMKAAGVYRGGEALTGVATATTVRRSGADVLTTDGPFAETKEQLGGFYLIEVADVDEALKWAKKLPTVDYGSVEVRPILAFDT